MSGMRLNIRHTMCSSGGDSPAALRDRRSVPRWDRPVFPAVSVSGHRSRPWLNTHRLSDGGYRFPVIWILGLLIATGSPDIPQQFVHTRTDSLHVGERMLRAPLQALIVMLNRGIAAAQLQRCPKH